MDAKHSANTLRAMVTQKRFQFFSSFYSFTENFIFFYLTISQKIFRYVSDLISVHRSLPDLRGEWCKEKDRSTLIMQMQRQRQQQCKDKDKDTAVQYVVHTKRKTLNVSGWQRTPACNCIPIFQVFGESSPYLCDCLLPQ